MKLNVSLSFFVGLIILSLQSCKPLEKDEIEIFEISKQSPITNSNKSDFWKTHNLSIHYNHTCTRIINDEFVFASLSVDLSKLYIYYSEKDSVLTLDMKNNNVPRSSIISLYLHTCDSIFILYENLPRKIDAETYILEGAELILFNSKLEILKRFRLNNIPNFFAASKKVLIENNIKNYQDRITDSRLLFPMAVYSPGTDKESFKDFHPSQLCYIDLNDESVQFLDVKFPKKDIGKEYGEKVRTNMVQFYIINSDSILYSFPHTSSLFIFDVKRNKSSVLKEFKNFPFENIEINKKTNTYGQYSFETTIYSKNQNVYIRKIIIKEYKNYKRTSIIQVLDRQFNHLGFLKDKDNSNIFCFGNELFIFDKEIAGKRPFHLKSTKNYTRTEFERIFLEHKKENLQKNIGNLDAKPIEIRMASYLSEIGLNDAKKIVVINTDIMCSSCIDYLMFTLKDNQEYFIEKKIHYLFIGDDVNVAVNLLSHFDIKIHIDFDLQRKYKNFFIPSEIRNYKLIDNSKNKLQIHNSTFKELHIKVPAFLELGQ